MTNNHWFMTLDVDRSGATLAWRYPAGVTLRDWEFMDRLSELAPAVAESLDKPVDSSVATQWLSARWFER